MDFRTCLRTVNLRKCWCLALASLAMLAACSKTPEPASAPDVDIAAGKAIAETTCSGCHGMDGRGLTADIPNLAGQPADYLVDALHAYKDGRRHHAALRDMASEMSEADIRNIAGYYASLPPIENAGTGAPLSAEASAYDEGGKIAAICVACHGDKGFSEKPGVPSLAGQQPAYLIVSTQEYANGSRGHAGKPAMMQGLEKVDIEKMAMYFASQIPPARQAPPFGDPQRGEPLSARCGGCHGARGISHDPLVPSLAGQEPTYLVNAMKAYRDHKREHEEMTIDNNDQEIEDMAAYYSVQRAQAAADPSAPVKALAAKCDRCHELAAGQSSMVVPSLDGQKRDYLIRVMKAYRDNDRGSSMMHKMSADYSDEMIDAIAAWYANKPAK